MIKFSFILNVMSTKNCHFFFLDPIIAVDLRGFFLSFNDFISGSRIISNLSLIFGDVTFKFTST